MRTCVRACARACVWPPFPVSLMLMQDASGACQCLCGAECCREQVETETADACFDDTLLDLLAQACTYPKDSLASMCATLASVGFGTALLRSSALWLRVFCALSIDKFGLDKPFESAKGANHRRIAAAQRKRGRGHDALATERLRTLAKIVDHVVFSLEHRRCFRSITRGRN